jgi:hypothetical protein
MSRKISCSVNGRRRGTNDQVCHYLASFLNISRFTAGNSNEESKNQTQLDELYDLSRFPPSRFIGNLKKLSPVSCLIDHDSDFGCENAGAILQMENNPARIRQL